MTRPERLAEIERWETALLAKLVREQAAPDYGIIEPSPVFEVVERCDCTVCRALSVIHLKAAA